MRKHTFLKILILIAVVAGMVYYASRKPAPYVFMECIFVFFVTMLVLFPPKERKKGQFAKKVLGVEDPQQLEEKKPDDLIVYEVEKVNSQEFIYYEDNSIIIKDYLFEYTKTEKKHNKIPVDALLILNEKTPSINIVEKNSVALTYVLDNLPDEDYSEKFLYFHGYIRYYGEIPVLMGEGIIIENDWEAHPDMFNDFEKTIYRFENYYLGASFDESIKNEYMKMRGADLEGKGLRLAGFLTPSNVRCVGICKDCGKTFVFNTKNYNLNHAEPVYSDDGLNTAKLSQKVVDKMNWSITLGGITYRYYNSFRCPHCGAPYIDYENNHEMKKFGNLGCLHLGKGDREIAALSELSNEAANMFFH